MPCSCSPRIKPTVQMDCRPRSPFPNGEGASPLAAPPPACSSTNFASNFGHATSAARVYPTSAPAPPTTTTRINPPPTSPPPYSTPITDEPARQTPGAGPKVPSRPQRGHLQRRTCFPVEVGSPTPRGLASHTPPLPGLGVASSYGAVRWRWGRRPREDWRRIHKTEGGAAGKTLGAADGLGCRAVGGQPEWAA